MEFYLFKTALIRLVYLWSILGSGCGRRGEPVEACTVQLSMHVCITMLTRIFVVPFLFLSQSVFVD